MQFIKYFSILLMSLCTSLVIHAQPNSDSTTSFKVFGACNQCKQRIQKTLKINGIRASNWDVASKMLTVTYSPSVISLDRIHKTIASVGHDTEKEKAQDDVYKALPDCCHYREMTEESDMAMNDSSLHEDQLMGIVIETKNGKVNPLAGASIMWLGTNEGAVSNPHGEFLLQKHANEDKLVISYSGFKTDTISVNGMNDIQINLNRKENLSEIVITARQRTTYVNSYSPFRTAIITKKELLKAACCNLSESFETNPSVDVSYN